MQIIKEQTGMSLTEFLDFQISKKQLLVFDGLRDVFDDIDDEEGGVETETNIEAY